MSTKLMIGIVSASALVRQLLAEFLTEARGHEVVPLPGEVTDGRPHRAPTVLLVASALLGRTLPQWRGTPALALVDGTDPAQLAHALQLGAAGVVDDTASLQDLVSALEVVASGQAWLPPTRLGEVLDQLAAGGCSIEREAVLSLTPRERQVMLLIGQGLTRQQVAERLFVSKHTARTHVQNVLAKLGAHSQLAVAAIARQAVRSGWIDLDLTGPYAEGLTGTAAPSVSPAARVRQAARAE